MKFRITKPRLLPGNRRAPYFGVRISYESAYEKQAHEQLFPDMGIAPKGEETKRATETRFGRIREQVEHRAYLLSLGRPVEDAEPILTRKRQYLEWGETEGGKRGHKWAAGHKEHVSKYLDDWIAALSLRTLADIKQGPFDAEKARLAKSLAPNTVNRRVDALKGFQTWAVACGHLQATAIKTRSLDKTPVTSRGAFALDELQALFGESPWSLVYRTAYFCRLRRGELAGLTVGNVLWAEGLIDLPAHAAKDRRRAFIPVPDGLLAELWAASLGKPLNAPLLDFSKKHAARNLHRDMGYLGIPLLRDGKRRDFHSLGASTATSMDRQGIAPALQSKTMRHKSFSQTEAYVKREAAEVRAVMQGLEDEIKHISDTFENEETAMPKESQGLTAQLARSPSPSAPLPAPGKIRRFPRKTVAPSKTPDLTWHQFQDFATQIRALIQAGEADTLKRLFALSPSDLRALLAKRSQA